MPSSKKRRRDTLDPAVAAGSPKRQQSDLDMRLRPENGSDALMDIDEHSLTQTSDICYGAVCNSSFDSNILCKSFLTPPSFV